MNMNDNRHDEGSEEEWRESDLCPYHDGTDSDPDYCWCGLVEQEREENDGLTLKEAEIEALMNQQPMPCLLIPKLPGPGEPEHD